jgi:predicted nuclease of predicted toxin-antitoxin system
MGETRFYLDENVTNAIAAGLRTRRIDVLTTAEAGNIGASDRDQLAFAQSTGRILITHDRDFLRLTSQNVPHAGIVYCAPQSCTVKQMLSRLLEIHNTLTPEDMHNHIEFL